MFHIKSKPEMHQTVDLSNFAFQQKQ